MVERARAMRLVASVGVVALVVGAWSMFDPSSSTATPAIQGSGLGTSISPHNQIRPLVSDDGRSSLGELVGREHIVKIFSKDGEIVYDIHELNGSLLASDLTPREAYESFPDLELENLHFGPDEGPTAVMMIETED